MTHFRISRTTRYRLSFLILVITISCVLISKEAVAGKKYFFSTSIGDDSRTSAQAQNQSTPWKTISKLNSFFSSLLPGDSVLFMRGESFSGTITINASGSITNPIAIDAYGTGLNPIISGLTIISDWTNEGNGIYSKALTYQSTPNLVTLDGVSKPLGRFPKSGYNVMDAVTSTSLTDADLNSSTTNYTGAIAVIRKHYYVIDRCPITNHSSHTLTITNPSSYTPTANWGYFIENHLSCLTQLGDWAFLSGKLYMYFGSNSPTSYTVQVSVLDKLLTASSRNFITINNLSFQGANVTALELTTCDNWILDGCEFKFSGKDGIKVGGGSDNNMISNNLFEDIHNTGIFVATYRGSTSNTTIKSNTFNRSAIYPGMGGDGSETGVACYLGCDNSLFENNRIYQAGFNGLYIDATYTNIIIRKNFISETNSIKNDGGGIYLFESAYTSAGGIKIIDNIVVNTQDAHIGTNGTNKLSHGIYLDGRTQSIEMYGNTSANNEGAGLLIGAWTRNIDMSKGNTLYNSQYQMRILRWTPETAYPNIDISNTIMFSKTAAQYSYLFECTSSFPNNPAGVKDFISNLGTVDNNYMGKITGDANISIIAELPSYLYKTLSTWKTYSNLDISSTQWSGAVNDLLFEYNETNTNKIVSLSGTYSDVFGTLYTGSINIAPYGSVILIKSSNTGINSPPTIQNQNFQLNENSPNGTVVGTVTATDPDASQTKTFSIVSGNTGSAFTINASTGVLTVATASTMNFESNPSFALIIKVQDNGTGNLSSQATVSVSLNDINESPIINNQSYSISESASNGTTVSTIVASDPDAGQLKTFSILSGNTNGAFAINASTGALTVATATAINFETTSSFPLVVKVQDNGTGSLSSQATTTVSITDVNEVPVINNQAFTVAENSTIGTIVGTVVATDPDLSQTKTFSIVSGNTSSAFAINASTGVLTVATASAINFESNPYIALVVKVQDNGTGTLSSQATINVSLTDINEVPVINTQSFIVAENSAIGTIVGTAVASDPDISQTMTFTIVSGNTNSAFAINASTGVLSVATASAINFESNPSYALVIKVQDNGTGTLSSQATINVSLTDINELPVINTQSFTLSENAAVGTIAGTVVATDPDISQTKTFSIVSGNTSSAFAINASTGELTVANSSAISYSINPTFTLTIKVTDNGTVALSNEAAITISVSQVVKKAPVVNNQAFSIAENSANAAIVGTIVTTAPGAGQAWDYSILSGNTNNAFAINALTGVLSVLTSASLNFEVTPSFTLVVKVQDNVNGSLSSQANITVSLLNVNDNPIIGNQSFSIAENSAKSSTIGTVIATDPDAGQTKTYSILSGNTSSAFSINTSTGVLTVRTVSALNFEVNPTFNLIIKVQDNGTGSLNSQATVTVSLLDVNESPSISNQSFSIAENSVNSSAVGTVVASDPDAGQTRTFSILSGNTNSAFTINSSTGILSVATSTALNYEATQTFSLVIKVQDNGTGTLSSQATITVSVTNVNETPVISNQSFSIAENSTNSTTIGTTVATDPDAGQTKTFSILSGNTNNAFAINSSTGVLTVATSASLNFEVTPTFSLIVKVKDNGTGTLSSQATITISVTNVNEAPIITNQTFSVAENAANSTSIGTIVATDPDAGQTRTFTILSGNTNSAFAINSSTGMLTITNSASLNAEITPSYTLVVKVQDNGTGNLSSQATITVLVTNVNETPVISNQSFSVAENALNATKVGTVVATDPDAGQTKTFSILSGNINNAFAINSSTGELTVTNSASLNFEVTPTFILVIKVQDNGAGNLSSQANITIDLTNVNEAPVISNQSFSVTEKSGNGTSIGMVEASDPDAGQTMSFSILSGNTNNAFAINALTGEISVANMDSLSFDITPNYTLTIKVQDNGTGNLSNQAFITISVLNVIEAPVIYNQSFSVAENSSKGTYIGKVLAIDTEVGLTKTFSITSGNSDNTFEINPSTGELSVADSSLLDFETTPNFTFEVSVRYSNAGSASNQAQITISLLDVNEAPILDNISLSVVENSAPGTKIGYVKATDPDQGQKVKYMIASGNDSHTFSLNDTSGLISVADPSKLFYGKNALFALTVIAQDNGKDSLSSLSIVTINLLPDSAEIIQSNKEIIPANETFNEKDITVYPNPTADIVNIDLSKISNQPVNVRIVSMTGSEIFSSVSQGEKKVVINMENEKTGTYIALISIDGHVFSKNIIVQQ